MKTTILSLFLLFSFCINLSLSAEINWTEEQRYGQTPPGTTPELYQPKLDFLDGFQAGKYLMSPNGSEMCLIVNDPNAEKRYNRNTIYFIQFENNQWTTPKAADFIPNKGKGVLPQFSSDGSQFTYSYRGDIWVSTKVNGQWTSATKLPSPVNSDTYECGFSYVNGDNFYFASNGRPEGKGKQCDIYVSKKTQGSFGPAINLDNLNTPSSECVLAVDPNERYIIFTRFCRKEGKNAVDLYIGFNKNNETWTTVKKLAAPINSPGSNYSPRLSYDGKYFFFNQADLETGEKTQYWVSTRFFEQMLN